MLKTVFLASAMSLSLCVAAGAQQAAPSSPAPSAPAQQAPAAPTIAVVNIVDVEQLPPETKTQVNEYVAKQGDDGLQKLRQSVDSTPEAKSALQQKGLTSEQVVAASLDNNGTLTLITKKKPS